MSHSLVQRNQHIAAGTQYLYLYGRIVGLKFSIQKMGTADFSEHQYVSTCLPACLTLFLLLLLEAQGISERLRFTSVS
jgi:hypothetical protein